MKVTSVDEPAHRYLRVAEAAKYIGLTASTLAKKRLRGDGPPYYKAGPRIVLYDVRDIDFWLASRRRHSTSESGDGVAT